ncbi:MAG TPA: DUF5667 domain-containing protein [Candidatus Saccharimonadales bacterium]|nr:DUF5667 domain-containing protein [Candidatus Saccharimonadales bacterium]
MLPRPEPREAFRRELRGRLMAEARVALAPRPTTRETAWVTLQRLWLRPAFVFAAIGIFLITGSGLAAAGSLPGDPAFALKRAAEDVQLALAPDESARIEVLATQADHRLAELSTATTERPAAAPTASAAYADAVARLNFAIAALRGKPDPGATKADAAREVAERARAKHIVVLDELEGRVGEEARDSIEQAKHEADKIGPDDHRPAKGPGAAPNRPPSRSAAGTARPAESDDHDNDEGARTAAPTARPTATRRPSTATPSPSIRR